MTPQGGYGERRPDAAQAGGGFQDSCAMWTNSPAPGGHRGAQAKLPYSHNHPAGITQGSLGPPERTTL